MPHVFEPHVFFTDSSSLRSLWSRAADGSLGCSCQSLEGWGVGVDCPWMALRVHFAQTSRWPGGLPLAVGGRWPLLGTLQLLIPGDNGFPGGGLASLEFGPDGFSGGIRGSWIQRGAPGVVRAGRMGPRPGPKFWASKPSLPFVSAKQMPHFLNFQKTIFLLHCNAPAIGSGHWMWEWPSPALNVGVTFPWLFLKPVLSEAGKSHPLYAKDKGKSFLKVRLDLSVRQKPNSSFLFLAARCPSLLIMLPETLLCNQWGRN